MPLSVQIQNKQNITEQPLIIIQGCHMCRFPTSSIGSTPQVETYFPRLIQSLICSFVSLLFTIPYPTFCLREKNRIYNLFLHHLSLFRYAILHDVFPNPYCNSLFHLLHILHPKIVPKNHSLISPFTIHCTVFCLIH